MKKFTFIRFIEPAEREEIGIGHYGEGRRGRETGGQWRGGGQEAPLLSRCLARCVCHCLVKCFWDAAQVRLAPWWKRRKDTKARKREAERSERAGGRARGGEQRRGAEGSGGERRAFGVWREEAGGSRRITT